jgi:16S rRNA (cytidine1402-2'-O)-methyltransferase
MAEADQTAAGGTLYVVATPIGNLGDMTPRAIEVLRHVAIVAAEDTRVTRKLWSTFGIETPLLSYHAHSGPGRRDELLARLGAGEDVALVSDAGTPLVSDPGDELVAAWAGSGGTVVAVPGASSVLAALVVSALPAPRWGFEGFLPRRGTERRARLARIAADDRATVVFESPNRAPETLEDLAAACGAERLAALARELTKMHEEVLRGTLGALARAARAEPLRGEVVIVIAGATPAQAAALSLAAGRERVAQLVAAGMKRTAASRLVAEETGLSRRELFRGAERGHEQAP